MTLRAPLSRLIPILLSATFMLLVSMALPASAQGFGGNGGGGSACPACDQKCERRSKNCENDINRNPLCRTPGGAAICSAKKKDCKRLERFCKKVDCGMMPSECSPPPGKPGRSGGEPHIRTFDGLGYDFQTIGEFILARSVDGSFETQVRTGPFNKSLAVNTAVGIRIQGAIIQMRADEKVMLIDGSPVEIEIDETLNVNDHLKITRLRKNSYAIGDDNGLTLLLSWVDTQIDYLNIEIDPSDAQKSSLEGMLGNYNNDYADDIATRDGTPLFGTARNKMKRINKDVLYGEFADAWRVDANSSILPYAPGETTENLTNRDFPERALTLADLSTEQYNQALAICLKAGVTGGSLLDNCIFDVGFTGDESHVAGYLGVRDAETVSVALVSEDASMTAAPTAPQSGPLSINWTGPSDPRAYIGVWGVDAADDAKSLKYVTLKDQSPVVLGRVPADTGNYELRYVSSSGEVLARQPLEVTKGTAEILFKSDSRSFPAASDVEVDCKAPRGSEDRYRLVAVEDTGEHTIVYSRGTQTVCGVHIDMPATPGAYELQYIIEGANETYVLAREPITVTDLVASLSPPDTITAGEEFEMAFEAPTGRWDDYFEFIPADGSASTKVRAIRNRDAQKMTAPEKPGRYTVRYMAETSAGIELLAETEIEVE